MHQVKVNTSSKPVLHFVLAVLSFAEKTMKDNMEIEGSFDDVYSITVEEIDDGQIEVFTGEESNTTDTSS
tara:strand:- start:28 stop:237 length:210 start_codon:yes stop_codon:yes gene_type:complete